MKKYFYTGILFGAVMLAGCKENEETEKQGKDEKEVIAEEQTVEAGLISNSDSNIVDSASPLKLTPEQQVEYHKRYVAIVEEEVNRRKLGIGIGVPPIEHFALEDWIEPKAYKIKIQGVVNRFLAAERQALDSVSNQIVGNIDGSTTIKTHIYVMDSLVPIEVTGSFETQYNAQMDRQLFTKVNKITSNATDKGEWQQTSYNASIVDDGQTYIIRIEGIYNYIGLSVEKAFNIDFNSEQIRKKS